MSHALFAVLCAGLALWVAPAGSDRRLVIPEHQELDALQQTLLIRDGIDRVLTAPTTYYDTRILHPDHNQLRTTEPFLGYVLLGLPFATVFQLDDVRVYEVLRWVIVFAGLVYAHALLLALGAGRALACAGALMCVLQPGLVTGFERLQVLSIPLIAGVVYHAYALWCGGERDRRHQVGLCVMATLYPLCGAYNITITGVAWLCVLPLLVRVAAGTETRVRLGRLAGPVLVAAILNVILLWPWLADRSDMSAYAGPAFLAIKHWNAAWAPGWLVWVSAVPWLYQIGVYVGLTVFLVWQARVTLPTSEQSWHALVSRVLVGLGVVGLVCSFGPDLPGLTNPMATDALRRLLDVVPPLKSVREYERFWAFGMTLFVLGGVGWLASARRSWRAAHSLVIAVALAVFAVWPLATRTTALTRVVEAASWFVSLARQAPGEGALYVHPLMTWNTSSCVLMLDAASQLARPIVNGCLGVPPPWFDPAAEVLHRFPDPEAIWLLRRWGVQAVVDLSNDQNDQEVQEDQNVRLVTAGAEGRVYALLNDGPLADHPSRADTAAFGHLTRVQVDDVVLREDGAVSVNVPDDVWVWAVEVRFRPDGLVVHPMPAEVVVTADTPGAPRLNRGGAGHWMQSLAADALIARAAPVAVITVDAPHRGPLRLAGAGRLSIDRVVVLAESSRR